jgi:ATP-dependent Clp endopeptidase proteolytic subunit ClpP
MAIDLKPTEAMAEEAERGLAWRDEFNRGGTEVGVARARDISNRRNLSPDTIRRMVSYFARHEVDKEGEGFSPGEEGYPSAGRIAWALWGGDAGQSWANEKNRQIDTEQESKMEILINNKVGKIKLNDAVTPWSADDLISEIEKQYGNKAVVENMVVGGFQCSSDDAIETIEIEINSPGGSVLDGYRIYNALMQMRSRGVEVVATVNTLAASMGSVILMAADKVKIVEGGRIMIHEASQTVSGDSEDHARAAKNLEEISEEISIIYANRTGAKPEEMRELMKKETWMGAKEAVDRKFADEIVKFDTGVKSMSILAKLFPNNDQVAQIEAAIQENESIRAELVSAQDQIKELQSQIEDKIQVQSELVEAKAKASEFEAKIVEQSEKIESLEKELTELDEKAGIKAAELLAATGHSAPVDLNNEAGESRSPLEIFESLKGAEATAFYKANRKAILAEQAKK